MKCRRLCCSAIGQALAATRDAARPVRMGRRGWLAGAGAFGAAGLLGASRAQASIAPLVGNTLDFTIQCATEQQILANTSPQLSVFSFANQGQVLVLDFPSLVQQGMMLNRVAALIEKSSTPRDRVLSDAELAAAISRDGDTVATYYYGHDYSAASLQRFFALAAEEQIVLSPEEAGLRNFLMQQGWLEPGLQAGLISIPAIGANSDITPATRATILHHELSHGVFFSDAAYSGFVREFWQSAMQEGERTAVRSFLGSEGYDERYEELMINEMQAYLMFTPNPEFFKADVVGMSAQRLAGLQSQFLEGMPAGWLRETLAASRV